MKCSYISSAFPALLLWQPPLAVQPVSLEGPPGGFSGGPWGFHGQTWGPLSCGAAPQVTQACPSTASLQEGLCQSQVSDWFSTICSSIWQRRSTGCSPGPGPEAHCSEGLKYSCLMEAVWGAVGSAPFAHRNGKCLNPWLDFFFLQNIS